MIDDPVVETINAILNGEDNFILLLQRPQLERIRDEIVALRDELATMKDAYDGLANSIRPAVAESVRVAQARIRDATLEEAARECDEEAKGSSEGFRDGCETCAAAIRTLKERSE